MIAWILIILQAVNAKQYLLETKNSKENNTNHFLVETKNSLETIGIVTRQPKSNIHKPIPGQGNVKNGNELI